MKGDTIRNVNITDEFIGIAENSDSEADEEKLRESQHEAEMQRAAMKRRVEAQYKKAEDSGCHEGEEFDRREAEEGKVRVEEGLEKGGLPPLGRHRGSSFLSARLCVCHGGRRECEVAIGRRASVRARAYSIPLRSGPLSRVKS